MDRYTIVVVGLCVALVIAYFVLGATVFKPEPAGFSPTPAAQPAATPVAPRSPTTPPALARPPEETSVAAAPEATPAVVASPVASPPEATEAPTPAIEQNDHIVVQTDKFKVVFTNRGAALRSLALLDYYATAEQKEAAKAAARKGERVEGNLELLSQVADGVDSLALYDDDSRHEFDRRLYEYNVQPPDQEGVQRVIFTATAGDLAVTKTFILKPGSRAIGVRVELSNLSVEPLKATYMLRSAAGMAPEQLICPPRDPEANALANARASATYARALIAARAGGLKLLSAVPQKGGGGGGCMCIPIGSGGREYKPYTDRPVAWAGVESTYFAVLLAPIDEDAHGAVPSPIGDYNVTCSLIAKPKEIAPGGVRKEEYLFYVGPKVYDQLDAFKEQRFAFLLEPKGFNPMARIGQALGWLLHLFHAIIPNYGVAIILMTILVRVALHPLTRSSQRSMYRMQQLQPRVAEVRERFKNDKQRTNEEMMKLYKESGVNPIGGCLPMLLQFPILIGLYTYLSRAIELRQEPFVFWINDLSQPDAVMCLGFDIPFLGRAINVLPLLMIGAMVAQQKMTPKSPDPQQQQTQKIMALMPIIFGFLFYSMSSGLVLYWLLSTGLGAAEQWYITERLKEADASGGDASKKPTLKLRRFKSP